jgi:hypothetical protein
MRSGIDRSAPSERRAAGLALAGGLVAVVLATIVGWDAPLVGLLVAPPPVVRFLLAAAALLVGLVLVMRAAERLGEAPPPPQAIRAIRLVFLAVGAFAAAIGWLVGSAVPIVAAIVIGGVDVVETSFLLLVTSRPGDGER